MKKIIALLACLSMCPTAALAFDDGATYGTARTEINAKAPGDATYLCQTANETLSAEQALSALASGLMFVNTTTGAVTSVPVTADVLTLLGAANYAAMTGLPYLSSTPSELTITGAVTESPLAATGAQLNIVAATITDASTPGTRAIGAANAIGIPTFASDGNAITVTDAISLYLAGPPVDGGANMELTNLWTLWVADGNAYFNDGITVDGSIIANGAQMKIPSSDADPTATAGYLRHDSTITNFTNGGLVYHNGAAIKQLVDMTTATAQACTDDQVVAYDADADLWYCKADADTGGATAWDDIGDPDAAAEIAFAGYQQTITSTLNSAGANITMTNTTADLTADVSFMDYKLTDDGDANGYFLRGYDNAGGDLQWYIGVGGKAYFVGGVEVPGTASGGQYSYALEDTDLGTSIAGFGVYGDLTHSTIYALPLAAPSGQVMSFATPGNQTMSDGETQSVSVGTWITPLTAETNSLETTVTGIADTEIFIGTGADAGSFVPLTSMTQDINTTGYVSGQANLLTDAAGAITITVNAVNYGTDTGDADIPDGACDAAGDVGNWVVLITSAADAYSLTSDDASNQFVIAANAAALTAGNELDVDGTMVSVVCIAAELWKVTGYMGAIPTDGEAAD